jgi:hypothetical protein
MRRVRQLSLQKAISLDLRSRSKSLSVSKKLKRDSSILSAQNVFRLALCLTGYNAAILSYPPRK